MKLLDDEFMRNYFGMINPIDHPEYFSGKLNDFTGKRDKKKRKKDKNKENEE